MIHDQATHLRQLTNQQKKYRRIYAITSGKGGVGKTNFTVNLAIALAQLGAKTLILDADIGMANIDIILGITPKYNIQHVIAGKLPLEKIILTGPENITIIPGVSGALGLNNLNTKQRHRLFEQMYKLEERLAPDYVFIDTGAGMAENVTTFLHAADEILVVTTPEPTAMLDAYSIIKTTVKQNPEVIIKIIVNMAKSPKEGESVFNRLTLITKKFLNYNLNYLGYIAKDNFVPESVKKQTPFILKYPFKPAAISIKLIANKLAAIKYSTKTSGIRRIFESVLRLPKI